MTKLGMKRTIPQLPLKRSKGLNKISPKQAKRSRELAKIEPPSDGLCELCKQPPDFRGLQKHHKVFRSHIGSDDRDNLVWVCGKCHSKLHGIKEVTG